MKYEASVRYLLSLGRELAAPTQAAATKFDLPKTTALAERLGRPDRASPSAHIAGTHADQWRGEKGRGIRRTPPPHQCGDRRAPRRRQTSRPSDLFQMRNRHGL